MQTQTKKAFLRKFKNFILFFIPKKYKEIKQQFQTPISIRIKNLTDQTFKNVSIFNSEIDKEQILIESKVYGISFKEIKSRLKIEGLRIGITYLMGTKPTQNIFHMFHVNKTIEGNKEERPMIFTIDPYQYQTGISVYKYIYDLNNNSDLFFPELQPNEEFCLVFYKLPILPPQTYFEKFVLWLKK